jgi:uncharacterized cupin superfamily protein
MSIDALIFFDEHEPQFEEYATPEDRCRKGRPLQRTWHHHTSADGKFFAGLWEAEAGCWAVDYTEDEFCQILAGRSILRDREGAERTLQPGDNFVIPAGFSGEWEVLERTKKIYVIYQP